MRAQALGVKPIPFSMLGLGDIVIPGIFVALMLRFDHKQGFSGSPYFTTNFVAYVLGLVATVSVMHFFDAAQPALEVRASVVKPEAVCATPFQTYAAAFYCNVRESRARQRPLAALLSLRQCLPPLKAP